MAWGIVSAHIYFNNKRNIKYNITLNTLKEPGLEQKDKIVIQRVSVLTTPRYVSNNIIAGFKKTVERS